MATDVRWLVLRNRARPQVPDDLKRELRTRVAAIRRRLVELEAEIQLEEAGARRRDRRR